MDKLALVLAGLGAVAALMWLFDTAYRAYRLDLLRFYIFRSRDELFEAADRGDLSFDSPAYGMTRQTLNGMIRFAHEIGLWRGVFAFLVFRRLDDPASKRFWRNYQRALRDAPPAGRKAAMIAMAEAHMALMSYVLHTSLVAFPFVFVAKWTLRLLLRVQRLSRLARNAIPPSVRRSLDHQAYEIGAQF